MTDTSFALNDILTEVQITKLITLWKKPNATTAEICTKIIEPNIGQINAKFAEAGIGKAELRANPKYIAYCCVHLLEKQHAKED